MCFPIRPTHLLLLCLGLTAAALLHAQVPSKNAVGQKPAPSAGMVDRAAIERGRASYKRFCAICHFETSTAKKIGPGMRGIYKRGTYADGKTVDDASMRAWIERGGKNMPGFKDSLKAEQVSELIAYLKTL